MKHKTFIHRIGSALAVGLLLFACFPDDPAVRPADNNLPISLGETPGEAEDVVNFSSREIPGKYIVVLNTSKTGGLAEGRVGRDLTRARELVLEQATNMFQLRREQVKEVYGLSINGFSATLSDAEVNSLRRDSRIRSVEADRELSLILPSPSIPVENGMQRTPYGVSRVGGGTTYTGSNVAWIIDTGIDLTHPDLNVLADRGFSAFKYGFDTLLTDGHGHGTHVAGIIAALDNGFGVVGVAAGAPVIPVKVLGRFGSGSMSGVIAGIDYVAAHGAVGDVANMSLGGFGYLALDEAVIAAAAKGINFTVAAGNWRINAKYFSPARANGTNLYTISAMDSADQLAKFSNWGSPPVDYCAPGVRVLSTWKGGSYNTLSGTSMAAPHAAGVFLLGAPITSGWVMGDKDETPDPIISHLVVPHTSDTATFDLRGSNDLPAY